MTEEVKAVVSLKGVVAALETLCDDTWAHVNPSTGEVRVVGRDELQIVEEDESTDGLPEWQRELVEEAREVYCSDEWIQLPTKRDIHEWEIMERFALSLGGERGETLQDAIHGAGAFGRFQRAIRRMGIEQDWFRFREESITDIAKAWLSRNEIPYE